MASAVANIVGKKILRESAQNHFGQDDPYFEHVPATDMMGESSGKTKKQRRAPPPGISPEDAKILTKVKRRAYRLDMSLFNCCGIRFGWSSVIGLIPAAGDVVDMMLAILVVKTCFKVKSLPASLKQRMVFNVVLDFVIGLVPFLGDIADALYRCNTRNAIILEKHLIKNAQLATKDQKEQRPAVATRPNGSYNNQRPEENLGPPPRYENVSGNRSRDPSQSRAAAPGAERARQAQQPTNGRGWFGGQRAREGDLEMGEARPPQPPRKDGPRI